MVNRLLTVALTLGTTVAAGGAIVGCDTGSSSRGKANFGPGSGTGANTSGTGSGAGGGGGGGGGTAVGAFSAGGTLNTERSNHTATLLSDAAQRVLVTCGLTTNSGILRDSEVYDPATNMWTIVDTISPTVSQGFLEDTLTANPGFFTARFNHTATSLPADPTLRVLITGGFGFERTNAGGPVGPESLVTSFTFDPATNAFTQVASMVSPRDLLTTIGVGTAQAVVAAGIDNTAGAGTSGGTLTTSELFDGATNTWTTVNTTFGQHTACVGLSVASTPSLIGGAAISRTTQGGLAVGGGAFAAPRVEIFTGGNTWSNATPNSVDRVFAGGAVGGNGNPFICGGQDGNLTVLDSSEFFDVQANNWVTGPTLSEAKVSCRVAELSTTSDMLVVGGLDATGTPSAVCDVYGVLNNAILGSLNMTSARVRHTATTLGDGRVLVVGGRDATGTFLNTTEIHTR